jgi:sugar lactone lactonase YvrE
MNPRAIVLVAPLALACHSSSSDGGAVSSGNTTKTTSAVTSSSARSAVPTSPFILTPPPENKFGVQGPRQPIALGTGTLETVMTLEGQMPTGVTVSMDDRIFLCFPHWADPIAFTVAEVKDGRPEPYPSEAYNHELTSVQSVYVDARNHLWILDTGSVNFGLVAPNAAKLIEFDLANNQPMATITFPPDVVLPRSYTNDVRIDLNRGKQGMAFITDSSSGGSNAIIVVDLDSKKSWRKLNDHPSVKPDPAFLGFVEGQPLYKDGGGGNPRKPFTAGVDGIALSSDYKRLYYSPLASRHLYSVAVDPLTDPKVNDQDTANTIIDHGDKGASDGLETDDKGRIYVTNYESNSIAQYDPDGYFETVVSDTRLLWPDTLSIGANGYLYVTSNQLHRQAMFHDGVDKREKPYSLFRVKIDGKKVR